MIIGSGPLDSKRRDVILFHFGGSVFNESEVMTTEYQVYCIKWNRTFLGIKVILFLQIVVEFLGTGGLNKKNKDSVKLKTIYKLQTNVMLALFIL